MNTDAPVVSSWATMVFREVEVLHFRPIHSKRLCLVQQPTMPARAYRQPAAPAR